MPNRHGLRPLTATRSRRESGKRPGDSPHAAGAAHGDTLVLDLRDPGTISHDADQVLAAAAAARPRRRRHRAALSSLGAVGIDLVAFCAAAPLAGLRLDAAVLSSAVIMLTYASALLYRRRLSMSVLDELPRAVKSTTLAFGVSTLFATLLGREDSLGTFVGFFVAFLGFSSVARMLMYALIRSKRRRSSRWRRRTLVLGAGVVGAALVEALREHPEYGLQPIGFADSDVPPAQVRGPVPLLVRDEATLQQALAEHDVDALVVAYGSVPEARLVDAVIAAVKQGCDIFVVPRLFELQHDGPEVESVRGLPLVRLRTDVRSTPAWWVKGAIDRSVAALAVVLLSPVLAAAAVAVVLDSGLPVLFRQERVGLNNRPITIFKFRSMRPENDEESRTRWNIASDARVSRIGRLLRKSSLDELPQLFNILRGDMSLVGPRPERPAFVAQFSRDHERYWARHRVPVGLTGWAQVHGLRGDTSIRERARYDNYYIANWSLWLDVKIVLLTLREVVRGAGA